MTGYDGFRITTIDVDKYNNKVIVNFNQDVYPNDINMDNITFLNKSNGSLLQYSLASYGKYIEITLQDYPDPTKEYLLYIENIRNVLEEMIESGLEKTITFINSITSTVSITSPSDFEKVSDVLLKWEEVNKLGSLINSYYLQVSSDIGFYNIIRETSVDSKTEIDLGSFDIGQYYIRCRAQNADDFGLWSDTVTFLVQTTGTEIPIEDPFPEPDIYPVFEKDLTILTMPDNGETPQSFIIEFDDKIDASSLKNIVIFRRSL